MPHTYLGKRTHAFYIVLLLFSLTFLSWLSVLVVLLVYALFFALFRKIPPEDSYSQGELKGALTSPVNGKVQRVFTDEVLHFFGQEYQGVGLVVSPWSEYGLVLPCAAEVQDYQMKPGKRTFRWLKLPKDWQSAFQGLGLTFKTRMGHEFGLQFFKCWLGGWPELGILPGDRGKAKATFGHLPYGGRLVVYIPHDCEILAKVGDDLVAGTSLLATPKSEDKTY